MKQYAHVIITSLFIITTTLSAAELKENLYTIPNVSPINSLQEGYIEDFYAIEREYEKKGIMILLKIVAATMQQTILIEQFEYDLLKQKHELEKNLQSLTSLYNQITQQINTCNEKIAQLSTLEKFIKEKKIKKEIVQFIKHQEELYTQFTTITRVIAQIDYALEMKNASSFKIQNYASPNKPCQKYIEILPIRLEIKNIKEHYLFKWMIYNEGKEHTLPPKEQQEYQEIRTWVIDSLLKLYKKTKFYFQKARELCLEESFELEHIYSEISYILQSIS